MTLDPLVCEVIAKRWCRLMGLDPYEIVPHAPEPILKVMPGIVCDTSPRWQVVARQVPAQVAWYRAISGQEE